MADQEPEDIVRERASSHTAWREERSATHEAQQQHEGRDIRSVRRPRWRGYTAFVLSGGTARGALQVGALRALLEYGERPDVIIGTSIGAWNGAWLARDPTLDGVESLAAIWRTTHPVRVLLGSEPRINTPQQAARASLTLAAARRVAARQPSLYSDAGLQYYITGSLGDVTFEEMAIPLRIIAADITHGTRAIFGSGPVAPAVLASSAIPGIFPPVRMGDTFYIDGGAVDNCSVETALALGARRLFVVDVGYGDSAASDSTWSDDSLLHPSRARGNATHPLAMVLERTIQTMSLYQLSRELEEVPPGIETHLIYAGTGVRGGSMEFERAPQWMEQGYEYTRQYLRTHVPRPISALS